ncbi:MAG TPA: hypothetical protein VF119_11245, partial [Candidatus Limnocylindrales bacterium]
MNAATTDATHAVILELEGVVTVGLFGGGEREVAVIRRQLGPLAVVHDRAPDLVIEFVDRLPDDGTLTALGREAAYGEEGLVIRRGRRKADVRVRIPLERLGERPVTITAERGLPAIPYLIPIVGITALARGVVPVHASAFVHEDRGVLVTGWAKGGKTEALLAFAERGATYVGDEWVFVSGDGRSMTGLPEPMRVWDWQLDQVPSLRARVGAGARARLRAAAGTTRALRTGAGLPAVRASAAGDAARRLGEIADRQRSIQVPPAQAFDGRVARGPVPLDAIVLIESTLGGEPSVGPLDAASLAGRVAAMVVHEWLDLGALLLAHRYAFPDRSVPRLEWIEGQLEAA